MALKTNHIGGEKAQGFFVFQEAGIAASLNAVFCIFPVNQVLKFRPYIPAILKSNTLKSGSISRLNS